MKWGGYNLGASERLARMLHRMIRGKALYTLMLIATLGLLLGSSIKWHPS
ncbi:hypothetical protein JW848_09640 [Candidatus Bipolaricaulota bacterium]|nr:hypothetical protein [Candidatus Bipolaricaulota bacterium]